jgi:hypothetical protein
MNVNRSQYQRLEDVMSSLTLNYANETCCYVTLLSESEKYGFQYGFIIQTGQCKASFRPATVQVPIIPDGTLSEHSEHRYSTTDRTVCASSDQDTAKNNDINYYPKSINLVPSRNEMRVLCSESKVVGAVTNSETV